MVCVPATAVRVPPQVVLAFGAGAILTVFPPDPMVVKLSVADMLTKDEALTFCNVIVSVEIPLGITCVGKKALETVRSLSVRTVRVAFTFPTGARFSSFVILPGGMVFVTAPDVLLVTQTSIRHICPALIVPPVQEIVVAPVGVLRVPLMQLALLVAGVELLMVTPAGKLSVMEKLVRLVSAGAVMSIRSLEFCPGSIVLGLNDLEAVMPAPTG